MSTTTGPPSHGGTALWSPIACAHPLIPPPEVELMTGWLTAAGQTITMDASDGHEMSSMDGMMTGEQMDTMAAMTGTEFDQKWLEMMIAHHNGAISQSETVKAKGSNADVLALADQIIAAQQDEITEMKALLQG